MIDERDITFSLAPHDDIKVLTGGITIRCQIAIDSFECKEAGSEAEAINRATQEIKHKIFDRLYGVELRESVLELFHLASDTANVAKYDRAREISNKIFAMLRPTYGQ